MSESEGSITVFAALTMMLVTSLLFGLLELARVSGLRYCAALETKIALESVCAEYQKVLWDEYHILALDGAYGSDEFSIEKVTNRMEYYVNRNLNKENESVFIRKVDLFSMEGNGSANYGYQLLTDGSGTVFLHLIAESMKQNLPMELAEELYESYTGGMSSEDIGSSLEDNVQNTKNMLDEAETVAQEESVEVPEYEGENPLEVAETLYSTGWLELVLPEGSDVSAESISVEQNLENREKRTGTIQTEAEEDWYQQILVMSYIDNYFGSFVEPLNDHELKYQMEYLLCGKGSDGENLESTVARLLLVREVANVTYLLTSREKLLSAEALALALGGWTGNPAIVKAVQATIIGIWALVESVLDLRTLLDGGKIAFIKNDSYWTTDISNLSQIFEGRQKAIECENGISYEGYLQQQLFLTNRQVLSYRMMDVMEHRLNQEEEFADCRMDCMIVQLNQGMSFVASPLFFQLETASDYEIEAFYFEEQKFFSYFP